MPLKISVVRRGELNNLSIRVRRRVADALRREVPKAARGIVARTQSGQDVDNNSFNSYSDSYAKFKARRTGSSSPVDLTLTGKMLGSIKSRVFKVLIGGVRAEITIGDTQKAQWNQEKGRRFFGLDREQRADIINAIREAIFRR